MTPIELTEEHKSKLLEMCKILFPEYKGGIFTHENAFNTSQIYLIGFIDENNDYIPNCDLYIHWFEFCMTHLSEKIYNKFGFDTGDFSDYIQNLISKKYYDDMHPIDYLYEEFKKLK